MSDSSSNSSVVQIPLTKGYIAIVDECDADLALSKWYTLKGVSTVYARRNILHTVNPKRGTEQLHRLIMCRVLGREITRFEFVDHINGDGLNNRRENLRLATARQNTQNRKGDPDGSSDYKGVSWYTRGKKWRAQINNSCGKKIALGYFANPKDAARAYNEAALKYHGEFAWLNPLSDNE